MTCKGEICWGNSGNVCLAPKKEAGKEKVLFSLWVFFVFPGFDSWNCCVWIVLQSGAQRRTLLRVTVEKQSWRPVAKAR